MKKYGPSPRLPFQDRLNEALEEHLKMGGSLIQRRPDGVWVERRPDGTEIVKPYRDRPDSVTRIAR